MTRDHDPAPRPAGPAEPLDDLALARLVRDVAEGWSMPPRRLDQPSWHDRVVLGRGGTRRGWLRRLAPAATLAVIATVGLSLAAVWLTLPRGPIGQAGGSPSPSGSVATPRITGRPVPTPLPRLVVNGDLPATTRILVRAGADYAVVDLATGTLGDPLTGGVGSGAVRRSADGSLACLCVETDGYASGAYTHAIVVLRNWDATGKEGARIPIGDYTGLPDPRPGNPADLPPHLDVSVAYSPDGRLGFVGWSARRPPVWQSGIVVVDLAARRVLQRVSLPQLSTGPADAIVNAFAPKVAVAPDGSRVLVSRSTYYWDRNPVVYHDGSDHFVAALGPAGLGSPAAFASGSECADGQADAGIAANGSAWLVCWTKDGGLIVARRLGADGAVLGETQINAAGEGGSWMVEPDGTAIDFWAAQTLTITRIDLATGAETSATAPTPTGSVGSDPLAALGRWLAPAVRAKIFLSPGIVRSPDGSRLYALGVSTGEQGLPGSSGVFVFDGRTLAPLGHWAPTADFTSIAASADGGSVYAIGAPGVDATGRQSAFGPSITVYDATSGAVRLIAGELGDVGDLEFITPILP